MGQLARPVDDTDTPTGFVWARRSFAGLGGWADADITVCLEAFVASAKILERDHLSAFGDGALRYSSDLIDKIGSFGLSSPDARRVLEAHLQPWELLRLCGAESAPGGFFTGYFEAEVDASATWSEAFPHPLYRRPPDLVDATDDALRASAQTSFSHMRRMPSGDLVPAWTRADIEAGALRARGLELAFVRDPVDAFVLQVQGSGLLRFTDGRTVRVSYDGKNGHPYRSVGRHLIGCGAISEDEMTLDVMIAWLRAAERRPQLIYILNHNPSFVFFKVIDDGQAHGARDVPLVPEVSLAVDPQFWPLGGLVIVDVDTGPSGEATPSRFARLMVAHDVGSAIRGPGRGDIFFGSGPAAGARAGRLRHIGRFIGLWPLGVDPTHAAGAKKHG